MHWFWVPAVPPAPSPLRSRGVGGRVQIANRTEASAPPPWPPDVNACYGPESASVAGWGSEAEESTNFWSIRPRWVWIRIRRNGAFCWSSRRPACPAGASSCTISFTLPPETRLLTLARAVRLPRRRQRPADAGRTGRAVAGRLDRPRVGRPAAGYNGGRRLPGRGGVVPEKEPLARGARLCYNEARQGRRAARTRVHAPHAPIRFGHKFASQLIVSSSYLAGPSFSRFFFFSGGPASDRPFGGGC